MIKTYEFKYNNETYRLEADWNTENCKWYNINNPDFYFDVDLADPGYWIAPDDESPVEMACFFQLLGSQDQMNVLHFLMKFNAALRQVMPPGNKQEFHQISWSFDKYILAE